MASKAEEIASRELRKILAGVPTGATIEESQEFQHALAAFEWFLPTVLAEIHPEWTRESLDGIYPHVAHKTGEGEAEILGLCCLMSDQTLTPIHIRLQISANTDEISWLELQLGEKGQGGMVRTPYSSGSIYKRLHALARRTNTIEWVYKVTFGQRSVRKQDMPAKVQR
jgi:hypothetical protein